MARKVAEKWKSKAYYIDHTKMVERKDLDTVIIATPNFSHYEQATLVAQAACSVKSRRKNSYSDN